MVDGLLGGYKELGVGIESNVPQAKSVTLFKWLVLKQLFAGGSDSVLKTTRVSAVSRENLGHVLGCIT